MPHGLTTHGHSVGMTQGGRPTSTYNTYRSMLARCYYPKNASYKDYGAKGVTVCESWRQSFSNFLADMGPRPIGHTLDRKEASAGYEPGNCRWATRKTQAREKCRLLTYNGKTMSVTDWATELGIKSKTLSQRLNQYGWSVERALSTPV